MPTTTHRNVRRTAVSEPSCSGEDLRSVMRLFPTGVALLRTGAGAQSTAMTINALMSVSLAPPLVMVSVLHGARAHPVLDGTRAFTAYLLAAPQADTARLFASRDKPAGHELAPFLERHVEPGVLATLHCRVTAVYPGGDHSLFLGQAETAEAGAAGLRPLVFHHGVLSGDGIV